MRAVALWCRSDGKRPEPVLTLFVSVAAYEKAGGAVLHDLFDDENEGWLTDPVLVNRLASEKLEAAAETVRGGPGMWLSPRWSASEPTPPQPPTTRSSPQAIRHSATKC